MTDLLRQELTAAPDKVVVKVGTRVLTHAGGVLNHERIARLAEDIHGLLAAGRKVVLVSSGAVGAGMSQLGLTTRPTDLATLQAVAAVGQTKLVEAYDRTFRHFGRHAAQVLLTAGDLKDRARYLNVRNTLLALLEFGAVPVINENDTVAVDELTFGDNDRLAALVTNLLRAPLLVILSDVEGLYDRDPADQQAQVIPTVTQLDESIYALVRDKATGLSKGGMASKLEAARMATLAGESVIIASGRRDDVLSRIFRAEPIGTLFLAHGKSISPLKRWIGFSAQPRGRILLDAGAQRAVWAGRSLLPIGIAGVEGPFAKGDVVSLCGPDGREIARGLTNYHAVEIEQIKGLKSEAVTALLGSSAYKVVVHCDNMAVVGKGGGQPRLAQD